MSQIAKRLGRVKRRVAVSVEQDLPYRHHVDIAAGVHRYSVEHGHWDCAIDPFVERALTRGKNKPYYDGIVARATPRLAALAASEGVPVVNVWAGSKARGLPAVFPAFEESGRLVANHLLAHGYRNFAFMGVAGTQGTQLQLSGFQWALAAANCTCMTRMNPDRYASTLRSWDRFIAGAEQWIRQWRLPMALFTSHDLGCRYMAEICLRSGLRIPEDVALVGANNEPTVCLYPEPSLSTVDYGYEQIGYEAAALLDRLMGGARAPRKPLVIDLVELIPRRSTNTYVVDDPLVGEALRFLAKHSHEKILVSDVAAHVLSTRRSLERHFRATLGRTIEQEIARLRVERAKRLLLESDQSVKQLALACGFTGTQHICRVFAKSEGVTPGAYRRHHAAAKPCRPSNSNPADPAHARRRGAGPLVGASRSKNPTNGLPSK